MKLCLLEAIELGGVLGTLEVLRTFDPLMGLRIVGKKDPVFFLITVDSCR